MTRLRQTIARRLKDAQNTAAMLTTFNEVDMTHVMALRSQYRDLFEKKHGVKLGFMGFFVRACVQALKEIPAVNAEIDGTDIIYKNYYHIGIAVGTERGLVVPVVRDCDEKSIAEIEKAITDFGRRARDGTLKIDEMQGGTFTITNGGIYGSLMSTPILNAPQSGILGMHKIQERPMVVAGKIEARPMMYLALSYDHRIVDGREAVTFLVRVKESLEEPARWCWICDPARTCPLAVCRLRDAGSCHPSMGPYDLIVIGTGPGGYVCAIRAAQLGLKTAVVEKNATFGGTCLNVGCIPSKAMLHASELYEEAGHNFAQMGIKVGKPSVDLAALLKYKQQNVDSNVKGVDFLFKKNKIEAFHGAGRIVAPGKVEVKGDDGKTQTLETKNIVIATGSDVARLNGIDIDEKRIVSSTGALDLANVPEKLLVVGAGIIGLELGSVWRRLGAQVTIVEFLDHILPGIDGEVARQFHRLLQKQGMAFKLSSKVTAIDNAGKTLKVKVEPAAGGGAAETMEADVVLVAIGRVPFTEGLGLEAVGVKKDNRGRVIVDAHLRTDVAGVYAIGDAIAGPMLAHKAEEEGVAAAEIIAGQAGHVNYDVIPNVVYTVPEIASVGKTEEELKAANIAYQVGKFPFTANARARANLATDGFVKILADAKTDRVLGVHILGPDAETMIAEAAHRHGVRRFVGRYRPHLPRPSDAEPRR